MRKLICIFMVVVCQASFAATPKSLPTLRIGVPHFYPPFVMQGMNKELFGFDILMMTQLCNIMQRSCVFVPMSTDQLITAVAKHNVDLGMGALTITLDRYRMVNFSIPYMLSSARFLEKIPTKNQKHLSYQHQRIGVKRGSSFSLDLARLNAMGSMNEIIVPFKHQNEMIAALSKGSIDLVLLDNATALYWQNHSGNKLHAVGSPFLLGFGLGIAVNKSEPMLTSQLNQSILAAQQTSAFRQLSEIYFGKLQ